MIRRVVEFCKINKRKLAVILVICCIVAELPFPRVQAAGTQPLGTETIGIIKDTEAAAALEPETASGSETSEKETEAAADTEKETEAAADKEKETEAAADTEKETEAAADTEKETEAAADTEKETEAVADTEKETEAAADTEKETEAVADTGVVEDTEKLVLRSPRAAVDRTEDTAELKINLEEMYILNKEDGNLTYKTGTNAGNTIYDVSENAYYDISKAKFKITFQILKSSDSESGGRTLKEGDYFTFRVPEVFTLNSKYANGTVEFGGIPIAVYEKGKDGTGADIIKFTFQKAVNGDQNYNNIAGGMNLELDFESSVLEGGGDKLVQLLPPRGENMGIQIQLPEEPSVVNGISKSGVHDSSDNTIVWTIQAGTEMESRGMSLNGLILEDEVGTGQTFVPGSAKLVNADGTPAAAGTVQEVVSGNTVTCTLNGANIKAPCYLQLKTAITKEKLEEAKASAAQPASMQFSNTAAMKAPTDGSLTIGSKSNANAEVNVQFGTKISKKGIQIDSNTIHWTIEVNNTTPRVHVYHGVVTDTLMRGLIYKTGSMTYKSDNGASQTPGTMNGATTPWPDNTLQITGTPADGQTLKFYMAEFAQNQYTIEFDTTVPEGFTGDIVDGKTVVTNDATVTAELPYWTGTGPGYVPWDYGIPGITCNFDSSMIEKKVSADLKTGILTWTILPSTRTGDYDDAVITDAIEAKQEYIAGTLKVEKKAVGTIGAGITINSTDPKNLKVTIPKTEGNPGDYIITYQTKGLNYFTENNTKQTYTNTAVLNIMKGSTSLAEKRADAKADMKNPFLAKSTTFEYINNTGYFHYAIDVNGNAMTLNNVGITDDLQNCTFTAQAADGTITNIPYGEWEFDASLCETKANGVADNTKKPVITGTRAEVNLGTISDKYTIHLYVKLKNKGLLTDISGAGLANKKIYSVNTVQAGSTEVAPAPGTTFSVISNSKEKNVFMDNTLVAKKTVDAESDKSKGLIKWNLVINPHGGPLSNAVITDAIPKSAKYVTNSAVLHNAVYNTSGKLEKGTLAVQPSFVFFVDKTSRYMRAALEQSTSGTYILEYVTAVVDNSKPSLTNKAGLSSGANEYGAAEWKMELSGGNWGTLSTAGKLEITKYDASVGSSMPLPGAEFTVFSDSGCTASVDMGETDASGKLLLYGLEAGTGDAGTRYYMKETKVPSSAYVENTTVYEVLIKRGETAKITVENERKTAATATRAEISKQFKYMDDALTEHVVKDRQSEFEIYFFPYGIDKNTGELNTTGKKKVQFEEKAAGDYIYSTNAAGTVSVVKNKTTDGMFVLTGLPWGYYGVKETKAPEGFAAFKDMKYFEINYEEPSGGFTVDFYFDASNKADNTITNDSISFSVKKLLKGTTEYLPDVTLQICKKASDGTLIAVTNPVTGQAYEWKTAASEAPAGHLVRNLPQGSYVLHEVADKTAPTLSLAEDIPFTVDMYGAMKQNGSAVTEITMYDMKNTLTIRKEDQFKEAVNGAEITVTGPDANLAGGYTKTISTADGKAVFTDLIRGGIYTVTETKVPDGYKKAEDVSIRVSEDGTKCYVRNADGTETEITDSLVMVDRKLLVQLKLSKTDAFSGAGLKDAEFSLFRAADTPGGTDTKMLDGIKTTVHTAGSGEWIGWDIADVAASVNNPFTAKPLKEGLKEGTYYLTETTVPDGYKAAKDTEFNVTVDGEMHVITTDYARIPEDDPEKIEVQDEPLTLRIEKYDAVTKAALTGAEFEITGIFAGDVTETTRVLAADASIQKNVLAGKLLPGNVYTVNEKKAPLGFQSIVTAYFMLDAAGNVKVTDAAGMADVREDVQAANPADEKNGTDGALQIYDEKINVDFVKCRGEDNQPISGAVFTVAGAFADGTSEKSLSPTETALAELDGLLIEGNTYTLTEDAPTGYLPLTGRVSFAYTSEKGLELEAGSDSHAAVVPASPGGNGYTNDTLVITNDSAQNTSLQFIKYDKEDNSGISGTVFELVFTPEGSSVSETSYYTLPEAGTVYEYETTGEVHRKVTAAGEAFFSELKRGTYVLTENASAYAYQLGDQPFSCTFTVDDRAVNKTIVVNKTNAENHAYDLTVTSGEKLLTEKGIVNNRMTGSVTLVKADALDQTQLLNDVGFTIYRYKDSENIVDFFRQIFTGKSYQAGEADWTESADAKGTLTIKNLPWGRYYIVETKPLEHYILDDTKYEFTIGKDQVTQVLDWTPGKKIVNAKRQMVIGQITTDGEKTIGNKMRLYGLFANYSGSYIEWTVGEDPYEIGGELLEGEGYRLCEVSPFDGCSSAKEIRFVYQESGIKILEGAEDIELTMDADGTFRMVQKVPPIRVSIEKKDESGAMLSGAAMKLEHIEADGTLKVIKEWNSSNEALKLEGILLSGGSYVLSETRAPEGYELAENIPFTVSDISDWQNIVMTDKKVIPKDTENTEEKSTEKPKPEPNGDRDNAAGGGTDAGIPPTQAAKSVLPKTGREARNVYYFFGAIFILAGSILCLSGKKKRRRLLKKNM